MDQNNHSIISHISNINSIAPIELMNCLENHTTNRIVSNLPIINLNFFPQKKSSIFSNSIEHRKNYSQKHLRYASALDINYHMSFSLKNKKIEESLKENFKYFIRNIGIRDEITFE